MSNKLTKEIRCGVCGVLFESEGLKSCPAHSFGDEFTEEEWELLSEPKEDNENIKA